MRNRKGITLVALVITIIILLILAGITISITMGQRGILKRAEEAGKEYSEAQAREKLEHVLLELQADKIVDISYNEKEYVNKKIQENGMMVTGDNVTVEGWQFQIDRNLLEIVFLKEDIPNMDYNKSLIGKISTIQTSGYHEIKVTTNEGEEIVYTMDVINYNDNLVLDGEIQIPRGILDNKKYEFGNKETDVATQVEDAKNMVVLKVNGDFTIEEGVTLTACKSEEGYGGPKGMLIYCTGTITNKGTISMTARGARAEGENVYLWQNEDESFEYIPAIGSVGGSGVFNDWYNTNGNPGNDGIDRKTGGGGAGGARSAYSGAGGTGTSYSGGTGGGGGHGDQNANATAGSDVGGTGGNAGVGWKYPWSATGGAGNPGGQSDRWDGSQHIEADSGANGTGGLLIVFANDFNNQNKIEANGITNMIQDECGSGGASGGGSINIFYHHLISQGNIEANGGEARGREAFGGNGGAGSITVGSIETGSFVCEYKNY